MSPDTQKEIRRDEEILLLEERSSAWHLVVWNDDVNTFDWVIESLVAICHHSYEQAEQCALFIHFKGRYAVKHGDLDTLRPMCEALLNRSITATIEETVDA